MKQQIQILLATDFSPCSDNALKWAVEWSRKAGAHVHVFHKIVGASNDWRSTTYDDIEMDDEQRSYVDSHIESISTQLDDAGLGYSFVFAGRGVSGFISQYVDEADIDYVFMGTHGEKHRNSGKMGSNAMKTLMEIQRPVLVTKEANEPFDLDNFVFASDFDEDAKNAFRQALEFVSPFNPEIHFLNIEVPRFLSGGTRFIMLDSIKDFRKIASQYKSTTHFHKDRMIGPGIIEFCNKNGVDLIVFSETSKTLFGGKTFAKPVQYLVRNASQPILFVDSSYSNET